MAPTVMARTTGDPGHQRRRIDTAEPHRQRGENGDQADREIDRHGGARRQQQVAHQVGKRSSTPPSPISPPAIPTTKPIATVGTIIWQSPATAVIEVHFPPVFCFGK